MCAGHGIVGVGGVLMAVVEIHLYDRSGCPRCAFDGREAEVRLHSLTVHRESVIGTPMERRRVGSTVDILQPFRHYSWS